ncbi:hypothetical protein J3F84DRAFT_278546 [Trichoderma pleuroticola]
MPFLSEVEKAVTDGNLIENQLFAPVWAKSDIDCLLSMRLTCGTTKPAANRQRAIRHGLQHHLQRSAPCLCQKLQHDRPIDLWQGPRDLHTEKYPTVTTQAAPSISTLLRQGITLRPIILDNRNSSQS